MVNVYMQAYGKETPNKSRNAAMLKSTLVTYEDFKYVKKQLVKMSRSNEADDMKP